MNTFAYVYANPLRFTDPLGLIVPPPPPSTIGAAGGIGALGGFGGLGGFGASSSSGWDDEFPGLEVPPGMPDNVDAWNDTNTETRQQCDALPPEPGDECERAFSNRRQTCQAWPGRARGLCLAAARVRYWLCRGGETFRTRPDHFDGDGPPGDGPNLTGF